MSCPSENLSPHPEIQEIPRCSHALEDHDGAARLVIAPVEAGLACASFPAITMRRWRFTLSVAKRYLPDMLVEHLLSVGYTRVDVVAEMLRPRSLFAAGILDVYSPEMDRPVRIDFFGDEIESDPRRFDPETQRSASTTLDVEALLLPLTERLQ